MHYFRARGRQELVDVQRELLKNAEDQLVTFREMYNVGQATRAEVHQANVQLQRQRLDLLMAENDFRQTFEELTALSGVDLPKSGLQTPLEGELSLIDWEEALQRLLQESPQMGAARSKLEADRLTIRREIAEPVPDIIVEGGAGYNFEARETVGAAAVMMEVPVFDWNQGTIWQAEADYARQQGELRRTELLLRQQLAQQYRNYLTAVQGVRNYQAVILPEARNAYDLRLQSYEEDRDAQRRTCRAGTGLRRDPPPPTLPPKSLTGRVVATLRLLEPDGPIRDIICQSLSAQQEGRIFRTEPRRFLCWHF